MRNAAIYFVCLLLSQQSIAQQNKYSVGFDSTQKVARSKKENVIYPIYLKATLRSFRDSTSYKVIVAPDVNASTLPPTAYTLDFTEKPFTTLDTNDHTKNVMFLTLKKDSLPDRARTLVLTLEVKVNGVAQPNTNNEGKFKKLEITVDKIELDTAIKGYTYLAYVGTNFDLVDGIQASNLFFATNIFLPPTKQKSIGFYLSLYGNRTMTSIDSTPDIRRETKIVSLNDTTVLVYTKQMSLVRTTQSDNLGAYCSPLFPIWNVSKNNNQLKLYLAPSLEFIWRRTHIDYLYTNGKNLDSLTRRDVRTSAVEYGDSYSNDVSEFAFNYGLGLMVVHESNDISVRVHASVGHSTYYTPISAGLTKGDLNGAPSGSNYNRLRDIFFTGRAWISEPSTGLTLQAEVTNTKKYPRPFYGVTLSKAINFRSLGNIFQPLVKR